jgi:hypothetical protein
LCVHSNKEGISGSGTRSRPIVYGKTPLPKQKNDKVAETSAKRESEPKRFGQRFGYFAAEGKVTRPGGRNAPRPFAPQARNTFSVPKTQKRMAKIV